jgi:NAD(P)H-flavin reductase
LIEQLRHDGQSRPAVLYWGCRRRADLYRDDWCREAAAGNALAALCARAVRTGGR